jgi:hypothetical protein
MIYEDIDDTTKEWERELGLLNDFLIWFWNNVILDVHFESSQLQDEATAGPYVSNLL